MSEKSLKINYFVGPFGSGKTSLIKRLVQDNPRLLLSYEDETMISFLKNPSVKDRQSFYLNVSFYKLKRVIDNFWKLQPAYKEILYDGHPLLALIYARTFFEIEYGKSISFPEWGLLNRQHARLFFFAEKIDMFKDLEQTIYYLNIPFDDNWGNVLKRGRRDSDEIDEGYLLNLRRILHQEIYSLADYYGCRLVELNTKQELDNLTL